METRFWCQIICKYLVSNVSLWQLSINFCTEDAPLFALPTKCCLKLVSDGFEFSLWFSDSISAMEFCLWLFGLENHVKQQLCFFGVIAAVVEEVFFCFAKILNVDASHWFQTWLLSSSFPRSNSFSFSWATLNVESSNRIT